MNVSLGHPSRKSRTRRSSLLPFVLALALGAPLVPTSPALSADEVFEGKKKSDRKESDEKKDSDEPSDKKPSDRKKAGDEKAGEKSRKAPDGKKTSSRGVSAATKDYVHEKLKQFLVPTEFSVMSDGRVRIRISFREKKDEHMAIFTRKFGSSLRDSFRYTIDQEEIVVGGDVGLRLSDQGRAMINCWFLADVEAEMEYLQYVTHNQRLIGAIVFETEKGRALGSNFGNQCVEFVKGRLARRPRNRSQAVSFNETARIKLAVRKGVFEAYRQGKKKQSAKYKEKYYPSGRIGFVWGGSTAVIVPSVTITGRLDYETMAKELKKYFAE